ncbi:hypothetical protein DNI29_22140 [Hymenobacter sediminis]|nr:hypothetical protein DNI29_22140 [Hymenobacter sediminis]
MYTDKLSSENTTCLNVYFASCCFFLSCCCASLPSYAQSAHGTYTIRREVASTQSSILTGCILTAASKQPLKVAMVAVNGVMLTTDTAGRFRAELLPGKYRIRAGFIGYYRVDVKKLKLRKGEQVALTVLVVEDDRPLY